MIRVVDTETLGLNAGDGICEVGWCDIVERDGKWEHGLPKNMLVNPGKPIPPAASAVHHIVDEDVRDAPALDEVLAEVIPAASDVVLAAHMAAFEKQALPNVGDRPWVCTWRCAVTLAPMAPGFKLQEIRYWMKLDVDREIADISHRAGPDAYVAAAFLTRMLNSGKRTVAELVDISSKPVVLPYLHFGMHAMVRLDETVDDSKGGWSWSVPTSYLEWIIKQPAKTTENPKGMDPDVRHTAFHWLNHRRSQ